MVHQIIQVVIENEQERYINNIRTYRGPDIANTDNFLVCIKQNQSPLPLSLAGVAMLACGLFAAFMKSPFYSLFAFEPFRLVNERDCNKISPAYPLK